MIPGIGAVRNGSQSWIALGPFSIQPAEFVKVALIGKLACNMKHTAGKSPFRLSHFVLILLPAALIMLQPDLGSAVIMIVSAFVILFLSGYPSIVFRYSRLCGSRSIRCPYRCSSLSFGTYKIVYRSLERSARSRISRDSVAVCDCTGRIVRPRLWQ